MYLHRDQAGVSIQLTSKEFESLAVFLAHFNDEEVVDKVGHECGARVNAIANQIAPIIVSSKEIE